AVLRRVVTAVSEFRDACQRCRSVHPGHAVAELRNPRSAGPVLRRGRGPGRSDDLEFVYQWRPARVLSQEDLPELLGHSEPDYADLYVANGDVRLAQELATPPFAGFRDSAKLDAPLAVQIQTRPGYFPFAKFSSVPLAVTAARDAAKQSKGNDANKRLMIVA